MTEPYIDAQVDSDWDVKHGFSSFPESRALKAHKAGYTVEPHSIEMGQGWPLTKNPSALGNEPVPRDGELASANLSRWGWLDGVHAPDGSAWPATRVKPGGLYHVTWNITASHKVRDLRYFCTKDGWDQNAKLTRAEFDPDPFAIITWDRDGQWPNQFWLCRRNPAYGFDQGGKSNASMHNWIRFPHKQGRHIVYCYWWVADTDKAFYQTLDLIFDDSLAAGEYQDDDE